jgi:hypothetical protein
VKPQTTWQVFVTALVLASVADPARGATITQWTFSTTNSGPLNSPAPDFGPGVAAVLGMTNTFLLTDGSTITGTGTFTGGTTVATQSTAFADITATPGDPNGYANAWRVRGAGPGSNAGNGWALQAPQYSQGAQFSTSTVGYTGISFHFDWFTTTQGVLNMQEQYTLDGRTWTNINAPLTAVSNGFYATPLTIDFSSIPGAANDPNFGVRLVSAYDNNLPFPNYGSANGGQGGYYNNNSGNWRFADVSFTGITAVPEPASLFLLAVGVGLSLSLARAESYTPSAIAWNASRAAARVWSTWTSVWARETNAASNWLQGR